MYILGHHAATRKEQPTCESASQPLFFAARAPGSATAASTTTSTLEALRHPRSPRGPASGRRMFAPRLGRPLCPSAQAEEVMRGAALEPDARAVRCAVQHTDALSTCRRYRGLTSARHAACTARCGLGWGTRSARCNKTAPRGLERGARAGRPLGVNQPEAAGRADASRRRSPGRTFGLLWLTALLPVARTPFDRVNERERYCSKVGNVPYLI
jgi:hypothetical protein